jgi:hypothetical protein
MVGWLYCFWAMARHSIIVERAWRSKLAHFMVARKH